MKTIRIIATLVVLLLSGCVSVNASRLEPGAARTPLKPDQVTIYRNAAQVKVSYIEVALLNATGDYAMTNEGQMFDEMRKKAASLGANGVILDSLSEPTTGAKVAQAFLGTQAARKGKAIAIYIDPLLLFQKP